MKATVITYALILMSQFLSAQGLILEDESYADIPKLTSIDGMKASDRPTSIDLSTYCPEVRNQGDVYSCVGWAVGYGALTIKKAIRNKWSDKNKITEQAYSAMFIYNQIKRGNCSQGARISDALNFLKTQGDCLASHFDTDIEDCEMQPDKNMLSKVNLDTITDFLSLFSVDATNHQKVNSLIRVLARKEPVIIGMNVRKNFYQLQGAKYWWPDLGNTTPAGGHAMVVVGYDLASASFLLFNSWGTNWGNNGFIRIKFDDFATYCKYAFMIRMEQNQLASNQQTQKETHPLKQLSAMAQLNYLNGFTSQNEPLFKPAELKTEGKGEYFCTHGSWYLGQLFQIATHAEEQGLYLYAFSIDANKEVHVHWPRTASLNLKFDGMNESPLLIDPDINVTIPDKTKALQLNTKGKDVMYLLYAIKPIKHPDFIAAKMKNCTSDYRHHLDQLLGKHLVPLTDIVFEQNTAAFAAATRSKGYIIPIIIISEAN